MFLCLLFASVGRNELRVRACILSLGLPAATCDFGQVVSVLSVLVCLE